MSGFWSELKRRNVFRVGIASAAVGWLAVQVASIFFPVFHAPEWVLPVFATLVVLGFPVALILASAFEVTPSGVMRTADAPPEQTARSRTSRRLEMLALTVLALLVAMFVVERFSIVEDVSDKIVETQALPSTGVPDVAIGARKSVVVLPFANLGNDPEQGYFSDGLTEDLLNRLAQIPRLKVTERSGSVRYLKIDARLEDLRQDPRYAKLIERVGLPL